MEFVGWRFPTPGRAEREYYWTSVPFVISIVWVPAELQLLLKLELPLNVIV
jgi:hypothetical protein